jgi:hypothetical protein
MSKEYKKKLDETKDILYKLNWEGMQLITRGSRSITWKRVDKKAENYKYTQTKKK